MITWASIIFPCAISPIIEQIILFHDHSIIILVIVTILIIYFVINILLNSLISRFILDHQTLEVLWTVRPIFLLVFIALPSLRLLYLIDEMFEYSIRVKITGHQWYWRYEYPDFCLQFYSFIVIPDSIRPNSFRLLDVDNRLILPINTNTRFIVTAADVIHAWSVPPLGLKVDAIPGRLNQLTGLSLYPGLYFGQCSEICGANHSFIPISLEITTINNFWLWINSAI